MNIVFVVIKRKKRNKKMVKYNPLCPIKTEDREKERKLERERVCVRERGR